MSVKYVQENPIDEFETKRNKKFLLILTIKHTAGRSGIVRRWCSLPNITVFSGNVSVVVKEHFAPITQPLVNVTLRPTWARFSLFICYGNKSQ